MTGVILTKKGYASASRPSSRAYAGMTVVRGEIILGGGLSSTVACDVRTYSNEWKIQRYEDIGLACRFGHSLNTYDDRYLVAFGGAGEFYFESKKRPFLTNLTIFDVECNKYINLDEEHCKFAPGPRAHHAACIVDNGLVVHGGIVEDETFNDWFLYDFHL